MYPAIVASMCEEVRNPARQVPQAMAWAIPVGFLSGMIFLLPVVFTLPDIAMLLAGEIILTAFMKLTGVCVQYLAVNLLEFYSQQ